MGRRSSSGASRKRHSNRPSESRDSSAIVIGGPHAVEAALEGDSGVKRVLVEQTAGARAQRLVSLAREVGVGVSIVGRGETDKLSGVKSQGVAAELTYRYRDLDEVLVPEAKMLVLLDGIEDPHNFGAILRSAEAVGVDAVILPGRRSVGVTAAVVRTSAGAAVRVPVCKAGNLVAAIDAVRDAGFWVVGLAAEDPESGAPPRRVTPAAKEDRVALVVGSEEQGIRRLVGEHCDEIASIPMFGGIESLNASVAAAVAMYRIRERFLY